MWFHHETDTGTDILQLAQAVASQWPPINISHDPMATIKQLVDH